MSMNRLFIWEYLLFNFTKNYDDLAAARRRRWTGDLCSPSPSLDALPSDNEMETMINRRLFVKALAVPMISSLTYTQSAFADDEQNSQSSNANSIRPFAPVDTLVPATRVRKMIDDAVDIATRLIKDGSDKKQRLLLVQLEGLLLPSQNFTRGYQSMDVPQRPAQSYLDSYAKERSDLPMLAKPGAALVQNGEIDTWKRLKRQEKVREDADEVRAALNFYTSNLNFNPDRYTLTGSKAERSQLIRGDRLPDVKNVIASDMGLRYLLRNDLLTALDDARAELQYQMKRQATQEGDEGGDGGVDGTELLEILLRAQTSCGKWFDLIGEEDVAAARKIVKEEKMASSQR